MSMPYSAARAASCAGSGAWLVSLGGGGSVRARAGSATARMKPSNPAGSVTRRNRAPSGEETVKVCGVLRGP